MLHLIPFRTYEKTITVGETKRSYFLHLPSGYDKTKQYPLVFMIHGYADHPLLIELYSGMSKKADKEKFIVVYPKGTNDEKDRNLSWNAEFCCGSARLNNVDDVQFIDDLFDELTTQYSVDEKSVYFAGFSNGAMFVHALASKVHFKIAAIAAISGSIGGSPNALPQTNPVPILIMNGRVDKTVPFEGEEGLYTSTQEAVNYWKANNQSVQMEEYEEKSYKKTTYSDKDGNNEVAFYDMYEGKHIWAGRRREFLKLLISRSNFTTNQVWDFFKKQKVYTN